MAGRDVSKRPDGRCRRYRHVDSNRFVQSGLTQRAVASFSESANRVGLIPSAILPDLMIATIKLIEHQFSDSHRPFDTATALNFPQLRYYAIERRQIDGGLSKVRHVAHTELNHACHCPPYPRHRMPARQVRYGVGHSRSGDTFRQGRIRKRNASVVSWIAVLTLVSFQPAKGDVRECFCGGRGRFELTTPLNRGQTQRF